MVPEKQKLIDRLKEKVIEDKYYARLIYIKILENKKMLVSGLLLEFRECTLEFSI